ncbi:uncharacterized protein METZ01_LOCUS380844 [marine metagenome]|uniref:Uncharacterized protein n=1 Tax=marine metagenome TaxID=408172 RepID=A0A382U120_9ZZZZ
MHNVDPELILGKINAVIEGEIEKGLACDCKKEFLKKFI